MRRSCSSLAAWRCLICWLLQVESIDYILNGFGEALVFLSKGENAEKSDFPASPNGVNHVGREQRIVRRKVDQTAKIDRQRRMTRQDSTERKPDFCTGNLDFFEAPMFVWLCDVSEQLTVNSEQADIESGSEKALNERKRESPKICREADF